MRNATTKLGVGTACAALAMAGLWAAAPAGAAVNVTRDAATASGAITDLLTPGTVTGSALNPIPPTAQCANGDDDDFDGFTDFGPDPQCGSTDDDDEAAPLTAPDTTGINPVATADTRLTQFPTAGASYAILSTGDATASGQPGFGSTSVNNRGSFYPARDQGSNAIFDLVTLRVNLNVPPESNCAQFEFRFFSNESTGGESPYNDAFIAELDASTFTIDPATQAPTAPNNFAFDEAGAVISVNAAGFNLENASGSGYFGATELLIASAPVTPGAHSVFFSLYDAGDAIVDSTVFIDRLTLANLSPSQCVTGARRAVPDPVQGESVNLRPIEGDVGVDIPGDNEGFMPLEQAVQVPVGSKVDTRKGRVQLTSAAGGGGGSASTSGVAGATQTAEFYDGVFQIKQGKKSDKTTLRLRGKSTCPGAAGGREARGASRKRKPKLWGSGSGSFTSQGNHGSASVRGTEWLLFEQCGGITGTTVKEGRVAFKNFYTGRTTIVKAGRTVLARPSAGPGPG